ncbi:MAG: hypothetical protein LBE55_06280 [Clostridiales bacterium]|nr:hypothetical protein [Clostridiales bacterium]
MSNTDKQMPKEVAAAISTIIKFLETTEKNFKCGGGVLPHAKDENFKDKTGHNKEESNHENS